MNTQDNPKSRIFNLSIEYSETRVFEPVEVELELAVSLLTPEGKPTDKAILDALRTYGAADTLGHNYYTDPGELDWRVCDDEATS